MKSIQNKRILVTGGAQGIGFAAARQFLQFGARVVVLDRDTARCESLAKLLPKLSGIIVSDVADFDAVEKAFVEMDSICGGIDVLVNNAGISIRHRFLDITPQEWQTVIDVNLTGVFYVAQQAARRMIKGTSGVIINISSTNGLVGYPNYASYNASKAAVIELTRSMALELAPFVRVVAICPGYVLTPMQQAEYSAEMIAEVNRKIPLGRHASPEEIASLIAFLSSDTASFMTGHCYVIDGGEIAGGLASR